MMTNLSSDIMPANAPADHRQWHSSAREAAAAI
jgi:hypothetical protein